MTTRREVVVLSLEEMRFSPTAFLFEGGSRAGVGISMFIVRTPPGGAVELHVHPYPETFLLLEGQGRWTAGDQVVDLQPNQMLVVPPDTAHGFKDATTDEERAEARAEFRRKLAQAEARMTPEKRDEVRAALGLDTRAA